MLNTLNTLQVSLQGLHLHHHMLPLSVLSQRSGQLRQVLERCSNIATRTLSGKRQSAYRRSRSEPLPSQDAGITPVCNVVLLQYVF